jgi:hypothetical protein
VNEVFGMHSWLLLSRPVHASVPSPSTDYLLLI